MKKILISTAIVLEAIATFAVNETISSKANSEPLPLPAFLSLIHI